MIKLNTISRKRTFRPNLGCRCLIPDHLRPPAINSTPSNTHNHKLSGVGTLVLHRWLGMDPDLEMDHILLQKESKFGSKSPMISP